MELFTESSKNTEFINFLTALAKTISRVSLYPLQHPLVLESIKESYQLLNNSLKIDQEIFLSLVDNKLLINGSQIPNPGSLPNIIGECLAKFQLCGIIFKNGVIEEELISFYKLFTNRPDKFKNIEDVRRFFNGEKICHIEPDSAIFARVEEGKEQGLTPGPETLAAEDSTAMINSIERMPLDSMLWEVVKKSTPKKEDQEKLFQIIYRQLEKDIETHVQLATQKLETEKETVQNEHVRTQSVLNRIADGVIMVDDAGKIIMMNPAAEKIYGSKFSDVKGLNIGERSNIELTIALAKGLGQPLTKESSQEIEVNSNASYEQTIRNSMATVQNPEGKIVGVVSILNDLAKQKELQSMQDDFLSNVTHELRSPLTAIKVSLSTFAELNQEQSNLLNIANRNIDRLNRLINDLLDSSKVSAGKMSVTPVPLDIEPLLSECAASLEPWAKKKNITLTLTKNQKIRQVMADPDRINQVLVNLISNAIKFTPEKGTITISTSMVELRAVQVFVHNTGPGIPKEKLNLLFQRFYQITQKEKSDSPGTGLGLFIAKAIVEMHKGTMYMHSEPGEGATFSFTLATVPQTAATPELVAAQTQFAQNKTKKSWFAKLFGST